MPLTLDPGPYVVSEPGLRYSVAFSGPVVVDSGPLIALFNAKDMWHAPVLAWLRASPGARLLSTLPVLTEVCAMLARRVHNGAALDCLRWASRGGLTLPESGPATLVDLLTISEKFADLPLDMADASVAELCERLEVPHILSIDRDFDIYRRKNGQALTNLLR